MKLHPGLEIEHAHVTTLFQENCEIREINGNIRKELHLSYITLSINVHH